jgi:hypothetical protein
MEKTRLGQIEWRAKEDSMAAISTQPVAEA